MGRVKASHEMRGAGYDRLRKEGLSITEIAEEEGIARTSVHRTLREYYKQLGRETGKPYEPKVQRWSPEDDALLGTVNDHVLAEQTGRDHSSIANRRWRLGIPPCLVRRTKAPDAPRKRKTPPARIVQPRVTSVLDSDDFAELLGSFGDQ